MSPTKVPSSSTSSLTKQEPHLGYPADDGRLIHLGCPKPARRWRLGGRDVDPSPDASCCMRFDVWACIRCSGRRGRLKGERRWLPSCHLCRGVALHRACQGWGDGPCQRLGGDGLVWCGAELLVDHDLTAQHIQLGGGEAVGPGAVRVHAHREARVSLHAQGTGPGGEPQNGCYMNDATRCGLHEATARPAGAAGCPYFPDTLLHGAGREFVILAQFSLGVLIDEFTHNVLVS